MSDKCSSKKLIDLRYNFCKSLKQNSSKHNNSMYFKISNIEASDYHKRLVITFTFLIILWWKDFFR